MYFILLSLIYNHLRQYFQTLQTLFQELTRSNEMKKDLTIKIRTRNKKIKKRPILPLKNGKQPSTSTSIKYDSEMQESVKIIPTQRSLKQQQKFIKKYFSEIFYDYGFQNQQISEIKNQLRNQLTFPSISIDKLFSQQEIFNFDNRYTSDDILEYLRILNNQLQNKRQKILLSNEGSTIQLTKQLNRQYNQLQHKGRFLTELEREVFQNHQNFIEKLKINQAKYQDSKSELSEISQQLLFLSKIYMENTSKIRKLGDQIAFKLNPFFPKPQHQAEKLYYEVIMKKNIAYAYNQFEIDFLNYFKQKDHEQRFFYDYFEKFDNENQFQTYLKNKRPKKGKHSKYGLLTACSCCYSDYYQSYNPLISCQNCNLRCHKLCYNLKQKSCGNCMYQRLLKSQKENIPFCFICNQKGQMTIKLGKDTYAHGFCLLFHNCWQINLKVSVLQTQNLLQKKLSEENSCSYKSDILIENQPKLDIVFYRNKIPNRKKEQQQCELWTKQFNQNFCAENIMLQQFQPINSGQAVCSSQNFCSACQKAFHRDFYSQCTICHKKFHGFCAFFQGHSFKVSSASNLANQNSFVQGSKVNILFDCCSKSPQEKEKLRKKRQYILNKDRFLFQNI